MSHQGKVSLVGAGPGDPGLITVKGLRLLETAEVVVYDRLVGRRLLERAPKGCELIDVGKLPGGRREAQGEINRLLVEKGKEGKRVVRLKGGDPFVFGRGGEEAEALADAGVSFEIVPGVTSAIAVPAYAGIPLTHRQLSSSFTVVSGSEDLSKEDTAINWGCLATGAGTLVVLMGWEALPRIVETLRANGLPGPTPIVLVRWGTEPHQKVVEGVLDDVVEKARKADFSPPVVAVIGEVVRLRERLRWFDRLPLFGKRVLVTRTREQASQLSELLMEHGAQPEELPTIQISPISDFSVVDRAISNMHRYQWVIFTSINAVEQLFSRLLALDKDSRAFSNAKICAIGPATAKALESNGIRADFVPKEYVSEEVALGLGKHLSPGHRVLLPRAAEAREVIVRELQNRGVSVDEVAVYHTVVPSDAKERAREIFSQGKIDVATFTSSSTVRNLYQLLEGDLSPLDGSVIACIGPVTAASAREVGLKVEVVAREHTVPGLVDAIIEHFKG